MAKNRILLLSVVCLVFIGLLNSAADAQRSRRKTASTKPAATPTPVRTQPEVISRADQYIDENGRVVTPSERSVDPSDDADATSTEGIATELEARLRLLEDKNKVDSDQKQRRLALNLDILTKAEQRVESLRKQYFEMVEKEGEVQQRLDTIEFDLRPDSIERNVAFAGSLRPEALREARQKNLSAEKSKLQTLLAEVQKNKANLNTNILRADSLVERLRVKLEKEIDEALTDSERPN
jgi:hypothetical protein